MVTVPEGDRGRILTSLLHSDLPWLLLAICFVFVDRLASGWKWLMLLRARDRGLRAWPVVQIFLVTSFLGYFLPSSIGGDALRAFSLGRLNRDLAASASSVVLDRAFGTLGLLGIAAVAILPVAGGLVSPADAVTIWVITSAALAGVLFLSSRRCHRLLERLAGIERGGMLRDLTGKVMRAFSSFVGNKVLLVKVFLFSLLVQFLRVLIVFCLGIAIGVEVDPFTYFVYVPIITVITFLPISVAGIGVREAGFLFFFGAQGVPAFACISLSLLYFSMGVVAAVPGALIFAAAGFGKKASLAAD